MAYVVATESFFFFDKKGRVPIKEGQTVKDSDPVVKANPAKFKALDEWAEGQSRVFSYVEAATAAPGETRTVIKPAAKKTKKPAAAKLSGETPATLED